MGALVAAALTLVPATGTAGTLEVNAAAAFPPSSEGLEVLLGLTCAAPDDLTVDAPSQIQGTFAACDNLTVEGVEVVAPGAVFRAEQSVTLGEAFAVAPGADLTIETGAPQLTRLGFVTDETPGSTTTYRARYRVNLDPLALGDGEELVNLVGSSAGGADHLQVVFTHDAAMNQDRVFVRARQDDFSFVDGPQVVVPAGWNLIEVKWVAGAGTGSLVLSLGGGVFNGVFDLDNDQARIDRVRWGAVAGTLPTTSGGFYLDEFVSGLF